MISEAVRQRRQSWAMYTGLEIPEVKADGLTIGDFYGWGKILVQVMALGNKAAQVRGKNEKGFFSEIFYVERAELKSCHKLKFKKANHESPLLQESC